MTHSRTQPGYTDNQTIVRARKDLTQWDLNISRSPDGLNGSEHTPVNPAIVNGDGFGSDNMQDVTVGRGQSLSRGSDAHYQRRKIDDTTIVDTASVQNIDTTSDIYVPAAAQTQNWTIDLVTESATGQQPREGEEIIISSTVNGAGNTVTIRSENGAVVIASFPVAYANQVSGSPMYMRARFDAIANLWRRVEFSADVSP